MKFVSIALLVSILVLTASLLLAHEGAHEQIVDLDRRIAAHPLDVPPSRRRSAAIVQMKTTVSEALVRLEGMQLTTVVAP